MAEIYKSKFPGQEIDERLELIPELQEGVEAAQQAADGKYTKPASGIPMTDLSDEVREAIEEGGGQADWAQTDTIAPDYIKNKPSIPTHVVRFVQQFLSDSERIQARANIGAGTYTKPSGGIPESDLADDVVPDVSDFITNTVNNLVNYYLKSETYSRSEVQQLIAAIQGVSFVSVASLPTPSADTMGGKIYLVPSANPDEQNVKDEFITIQDGNTYTWEQIGSTAVNLSGYVTTQQLNNALAAYTTTEALTTLLAAKQDTISDLSAIRSGAAAGATAYQKPQTGIPASDLAPGVIPTVPKDVVKYSSQSLTDAQKAQARTNIGAAAAAALTALETAIAAKYTKPSNGIPETDLEANVRSALALARTSIQSLVDYYDKTEIDALLAAVSSEQYVDVTTLPTASASTLGKIYLVGPTNGVYDRYYTSYDGTTYSWVGVGTTEINLANYATKEELNQLGQGVTVNQSVTEARPIFIPFEIVAGKRYKFITPLGSVSYNVGYCDTSGAASKENLLIQVTPGTESGYLTPTYSGHFLRLYPISSGTLLLKAYAEGSIPDIIHSVDAQIEQVNEKVGDLDNLSTPNKDSVVGAINSIVNPAEIVLNVDLTGVLSGIFYNDSAGNVSEVQNAGSKYLAPIDISAYVGGTIEISGGYAGSGRLTGIADASGKWITYKTDGEVASAGSVTISIPSSAKYLYISFSANAIGEGVSISYTSQSVLQESIAAVRFVDGVSGADTNDGQSSDRPFATIQKAIKDGGRIICVHPGTYQESVTLSGVSGIKIMPYGWGNYSVSSPDSPKIIIDANNTITSAIVINGCNDVHLCGFELKNTTSHIVDIANSQNIMMQDCLAHNNAAGMAFRLNNVCGRFVNCIAHDVAVDGFNIHGYGDTIFENCKAYNCGDDGISHHDGCTGIIQGGEFYNCVKGGVASPAHGAAIDIEGVYSHDNAYGIYAVSSDDRRAVSGLVKNCAILDNSAADIAVDNGNIVVWNTLYDTTYVTSDATLTVLSKASNSTPN